MLQGTERHNGIFIHTTNLLDRIDRVALQRFTFKIKFMPLTLVRRELMFVTEALESDAALLTDELRARLTKLAQICPNDFAAVKRQTSNVKPTFWAQHF